MQFDPAKRLRTFELDVRARADGEQEDDAEGTKVEQGRHCVECLAPSHDRGLHRSAGQPTVSLRWLPAGGYIPFGERGGNPDCPRGRPRRVTCVERRTIFKTIWIALAGVSRLAGTSRRAYRSPDSCAGTLASRAGSKYQARPHFCEGLCQCRPRRTKASYAGGGVRHRNAHDSPLSMYAEQAFHHFCTGYVAIGKESTVDALLTGRHARLDGGRLDLKWDTEDPASKRARNAGIVVP